jgi:alkanesulfonate monooxygenase SsuD/methylene tetrahydromethanopterin reductase-like flavin-dependent oxidoreductase (luciferase family)
MRSADDERTRLAAAQVLLDRGYGRPEQPPAGPLVSINLPAAGRAFTAQEALAYVVSGQLPPDEEREAVEFLQREAAAARPVIEAQVIETPAASIEGSS